MPKEIIATTKHSLIILCAVLFVGTGSAARAEGPIFTAGQWAKLKATGREVVAPGHLPAGYRVEGIIVDRQHPATPSSAILFAGPGKACFVVEMGTEVGDVIVENEKGGILEAASEVRNPLLGKTQFWDVPEYLGTDWFPPHRGAAYCVKGDVAQSMFSRDAAARRLCTKRMDGAELMKVAESLRVVEG